MGKMAIGNSDIFISAIGLGCWGMSDAYGQADRAESIATIQMAVDMGITLLDTADVYGSGDNERLVGEAIKGRRSQVVLATKFGFVGDEHGTLTVCGKPEYVKDACAASLKRLHTDVIDIFHLHRIDPAVPVEDTVGAMAQLIDEGKVRALGLSEVSATTLARAEKVHHIDFLQSEYSLFTKDIEQEVLPACRTAGTNILAFSPLGRGFLTGGVIAETQLEKGDYRAGLPRFQGENLSNNLAILKKIQALALDKKITSSQLALAWLLHQGADIFPIPGMKRRKYLRENLDALAVNLTPAEMQFLRDATREISGSRHNAANLQFIDR
jgi:aryl-alcohol dehydrogenase-like predicted oxidoreductase